MGPFKQSRFGNSYIITAIDNHTKYLEAAPTPSFAEITASFIFVNFMCHYGMVEQILTDQGVNFESKLLKHLCILMGTEKLYT